MIKFLYKFRSYPIWLNNSPTSNCFLINRCIFSRIFVSGFASNFQIKRVLFQECFKINKIQLASTPLLTFNENRKSFSVVKTKIAPLEYDSDSVTLNPVVDVDQNKSIPIVSEKIKKNNDDQLNQLSNEFAESISNNPLINNNNLWKDVPTLKLSNVINDYSKLAKIKLTGLVVLTTLSGFYMGLESSLNGSLLMSTLIGTALTSGSAAAWNHFLEVPFDSQMTRTQNRPLVQGSISSLHAALFASITSISGLTILATCVNPLTALLGGINLCLYSFVYTPMKRVHISNTWIGSIVGAIPPIMGFTAVSNQIGPSGLLLGLLLYSWQFPHFNALSWNMRHEYARAGYRMMSVTDPKLCQNTALRHSVLLLTYSGVMCATDMTHWSFFIDSAPFNLYLIYLACKFRTEPSSKTSRKLFLYSLIYLPVIILLMAISKNRNKTTNTKTITNTET